MPQARARQKVVVRAMNNLIVRDGKSQDMRALPALQDGYFNLDEMPFANLLAMATEYARLVKFYQLDNQPDGDWKPYFAADETIVIAQILSTRLSVSEAYFELWWNKTPEYKIGVAAPGWRIADLPMTGLARLLDGWLVALASTNGVTAQKLRLLLISVIERLCEDTSGFAAFLAAPGAGLALDPVWNEARGRSTAPRARVTKTSIKSNYYAFVKAVEMVQKEALLQLPDSMKSQTHDPAVGLLIAFIRLFDTLKKKLNRFTQRHLDFYYDQVLRIKPLGAVPDHTYLILEPTNPGLQVRIGAGTEFLAGLDAANRDILYAADGELIVTDAQVQALHTLFFNRDRYISPERRLSEEDASALAEGRKKGWPTHAWCDRIPVPVKQVVTDRDKLRSRPLLGAPRSISEMQHFSDARIGFALASNVLLLREGRRSVSVTLQFETADLEKRIAALALVMRAEEEKSGTAQGESDDMHLSDVFYKAFQNMFRIAVTTTTGWFEVADYVPSHGPNPNGEQASWLRVAFELPLDAPAVVPYSSKIHGDGYVADVPVVRFVLNPNAYLYPYGLLRELPLAAARIEVAVAGCRQLVLHNNIGQLSATTPFNPFGPIPEVGAFLIVGSGEAAGKRLHSFDVQVEWSGLPTDGGGFRSYYRGYRSTVDTEDYVAAVSVLTDGVWVPVEEKAQPVVRLFNTGQNNSASKRIDKNATLSCDGVIHRFKPNPVTLPAQPLAYSPASRGGFFKFTLAGPKFAFGHREYPHALADSLKRNFKQKDWSLHKDTPDVPYTPLIDSISVDYTASATIRLDQPRAQLRSTWDNILVHLHPQGWEAIGSASEPAPMLIPVYPDAGNLHIGISATTMKSIVTLFFHLREDSLPLDRRTAGQVRWSYLSDNQWKSFYPQNIVSDTTHGFMVSGVVALNIPADISDSNTVMPAGLFWLRVSASGSLEKFCSVYSVYTQALRVTRQRAADRQDEPAIILPAATIKRTRKIIPGLGKITQAIDSVGGRCAETRPQLRLRVAERLRHKQRAVTAADYESLILQQFPDIYKVKCFANMATDRGPDDCVRPGHVLIVALPHLPTGDRNRTPLLNGNLVHEVGDFVSRLASPSATISVENPVYEQIQIRCTVRLKKGLSGGYYINRLNDDISEFLSPWSGRGYRVHFGWCVRQHDVESFILGQDYVDSVTGFSMLRIAPTGEDTYSLSDTAAEQDAASGVQITPRYPWSIAVPIRMHAIDITLAPASLPPERVGLKTLDIGSTFIISPGDKNGQTQ